MTVAPLALAACGSQSYRGPGSPCGPSPVQDETTSAVACRVKPYAAADGSVPRAALDRGLHTAFAAADTDGDGIATTEEMAFAGRPSRGRAGPPPGSAQGPGRPQ